MLNISKMIYLLSTYNIWAPDYKLIIRTYYKSIKQKIVNYQYK